MEFWVDGSHDLKVLPFNLWLSRMSSLFYHERRLPCSSATLFLSTGVAILPQLYLLNDIPIYPKVSGSWFLVFSFIFIASFLKYLQEVVSSGGTIQTWWNEQQIWMLKSVTAYTYEV